MCSLLSHFFHFYLEKEILLSLFEEKKVIDKYRIIWFDICISISKCDFTQSWKFNCFDFSNKTNVLIDLHSI